MGTQFVLTAEAIMAEYPRLVRLARWYVREDAEDAAQEAVYKAWTHRDRYDGHMRLRNWLLHITQNVCIDMLRRRARRPKTVGLEAAEHLGRDGVVDRVAAHDLVERALSAAPEQVRPVVKLWAVGFTQVEIAKALRIPAGTAATRLMWGKRYARRYAERSTGPRSSA